MREHLNDILIFMEVVKAGSFVGGGQAVGLTRSAAGKAVGRLEDRLGTRLLNRTTRALHLTDEGRSLYEHGLRILAAVDEAEASLAGGAGAPRGLLRMTLPDAFGRLVILPLLEKYLKAWPEVQIEASLTDRVADLVEEGFDLAVRVGGSARDDATTSDSQQISRVIARYRVMVCAAPSYLTEHGEPANVGDLTSHELLVFSSRTRKQSWDILEDGAWLRARGRSRLRFDSGEALRDAAVAGLGIAYLPEFLVEADLEAGRLRQVLPHLEPAYTNVVVVYPTRRLLEPRVRHFIDMIVDELADHRSRYSDHR